MSSSMHLSKMRKWFASSPPVEWGIGHIRELLIGALKQGPIPQHVAFVMDGNRRFARNHAIERVEGHNLGFEALAKILEVCYKAGVKVVTIYAFSIENFKRSKFEVDALMEMAKVKLSQLSQHGDLLDRYGASTIREQAPSAEPNPKEVELVSEEDRSTIEPPSSFSSTTTLQQSQMASKLSTVSGPYTSYPPNSDQLIFLSPETISTQTLDDHMLTADSPPLDLLIRTSGVERLSDFMLWQCHEDTDIIFLDTLWPSFGLWDFLPVLWEWQWRVRKQGRRRHTHSARGSALRDTQLSSSMSNEWSSDDEHMAKKMKSL
ncbi:dehydrodolichyl diphosphate synthase [Coccidioides immitis RMSCC 3703]|uniref:Alkyl transferase n=1 Tax=Coccidioides immitis RMSCC 3703 TaxID=454286 RepID=A0A0J8QWS8_COCIT|nr:dehydrodolichyl diphosphate synthase [Coccidioides immitis RMSCC 3703]